MPRRDRTPPPPVTSSPFAKLADLAAALPASTAPAEAPRPAEPPPAGAEFPGKVVVRHERKGRGGKTVTRVSGVAPDRRAALLAELKKALGCGGVVEDDDLVLLGAVADRAAAWLRARGARRVVLGT